MGGCGTLTQELACVPAASAAQIRLCGTHTALLLVHLSVDEGGGISAVVPRRSYKLFKASLFMAGFAAGALLCCVVASMANFGACRLSRRGRGRLCGVRAGGRATAGASPVVLGVLVAAAGAVRRSRAGALARVRWAPDTKRACARRPCRHDLRHDARRELRLWRVCVWVHRRRRGWPHRWVAPLAAAVVATAS